MNWEYIIAEKFCDSVRDGTHDTPKPVDIGYKLVTGKHIKNGQIDPTDAYCISEKDYISINARSLVEQWDVLMSMIGTVGESAVVKTQPDYAIKNVALFKCGSSELKGKWLNYYLHSPEAQGKMLGNMKGSSQQFLSLKQLRNLPILTTDEPTMRKIVGILSAYDDLIENNQKQIKLLEEAAQRLYKEWFVDLHFPSHESTPIIDGIPQGWKKEEFSQVFNFVRGKSYTSQELSEDNGVLMVNLKNIRAWGGYKRNAEKRFIGQYKESQTLEAGDVVMSVTDMTQERRLVGHVAMIPDFNEPATFSMDLIKLLPYEITKNYLYAVLQYGDYGKEISILANGTNVLHLKPEAMMKMKMLIPKNDILSAFEKVFESIRKQLEILQNQCELAIEARDRLLPKLMNGEIKVGMDKQETAKKDNFDYIRKHWRDTPYDEDLPLAARSTGDISEETHEKLKEIAEEE